MDFLNLEPRHLQMVREILQRYVPRNRVYAFGSRATGRYLKKFSDLDLAIEGELPQGAFGHLIDAFDESLLPIKVDIVETRVTSPEFLERVEKDFVALQ